MDKIFEEQINPITHGGATTLWEDWTGYYVKVHYHKVLFMFVTLISNICLVVGSGFDTIQNTIHF